MAFLFKTELTGFIGLAVLSAGLGFGGNFFRKPPLPLIYQPKSQRLEQAVTRLSTSGPAPAVLAGPSAVQAEPIVIEVDEFQKRVDEKSALILDARPAVFHKMGHVPGALSLPRESFEESYGRQRAALQAAKDRDLIVYCSDASCTDSDLVAKSLIQLGHGRVFVFKGGWELWTQLGMPEEKP